MQDSYQTDFAVEYVEVGPYAHGFGTSEDGLPYSFRVTGRTLVVDVYREGADTVPQPDDVVARAEGSVTEIDLADERSIVAFVRDLVAAAEPTTI